MHALGCANNSARCSSSDWRKWHGPWRGDTAVMVMGVMGVVVGMRVAEDGLHEGCCQGHVHTVHTRHAGVWRRRRRMVAIHAHAEEGCHILLLLLLVRIHVCQGRLNNIFHCEQWLNLAWCSTLNAKWIKQATGDPSKKLS